MGRAICVSLKLMNLTPYSIHRFSFSLQTTSESLSDTTPPRAWLKDQTPLYTQIATREGNGYAEQVLEVFFPSPVSSGQTLELSYALAHVGVHQSGKNRYRVRIERPCTSFCLEMSCARLWRIRDPLVFLPGKERDIIQPEQVDDHHLIWQRSFPIPMWTYQVCFDLALGEHDGRPIKDGH
jgi:hypothetical protein